MTSPGRAHRWARALAIPLLLAGAACTSPAADGPAAAGPDAALSGRVTVLAAASLSDAFSEIAEGFERSHPDVDVVLNLGSSSALAQQVVSGAPADVFAAASPATMATVVEAGEAGEAGEPLVVARNRLQIAVPAGNPGSVTGLADFADEDLALALCAPQVPCGAAARTVLAEAGVTAAPDTLEQDVKAALAKVRLGEVDAALVYRTDVLAAADEVEGIAFPEAARAANAYLVVTLTGAPNPAAAAAFVAEVLSERGQRALADAGFERP